MLVSIIYVIISLILDGLMSNVFPGTLNDINYMQTIYVIISLVIIYPYFDDNKKYFILAFVFGLLFDILYTSSFVFNAILFVLIAFVIKVLNNFFPVNVFVDNMCSIVAILIYHTMSFLILSMISSVNYDLILLGKALTSSIIMTVVYTTISYFVMGMIYRKCNIKQMK